MDKNRKKELLDEFKKDELEKLSKSSDSVFADYAKNKLGLKSDQLTIEKLHNTPDDKLIETITRKINEVIALRYKSDPKNYKHADNVISELNQSLRAIHYTSIFEMYVTIGDTDKFLNEPTTFELREVINGYRLLELNFIADRISITTMNEIEKELRDQEKITRTKTNYIRGHLNEFVLI
jgi:hypothetical protein